MEFDDLENLIQCCSICQYKYDDKVKKQRPYVMSCGHTFCGACLEPNQNKCYTCRVVHKKAATVNYQLEDQIKAIKDYKEIHKCNLLKPFQNMLVCLDCSVPLMKSESDTLELLHDGHEIIKCEGTGESQLKQAVWFLDIFNRRASARTKFEKILQSILYVGKQYQNGLDSYLSAVQDTKFEDKLGESLKDLLSHKIKPENAENSEPEFISHLKKMMVIESALGSSIHRLAYKCSTLEQDGQFKAEKTTYQEMFVDLGKDDKKGLHILPHKRHLAILPELQLRVSDLSSRHQFDGYNTWHNSPVRGGYSSRGERRPGRYENSD